jgi:hypothetical protein
MSGAIDNMLNPNGGNVTELTVRIGIAPLQVENAFNTLSQQYVRLVFASTDMDQTGKQIVDIAEEPIFLPWFISKYEPQNPIYRDPLLDNVRGEVQALPRSAIEGSPFAPVYTQGIPSINRVANLIEVNRVQKTKLREASMFFTAVGTATDGSQAPDNTNYYYTLSTHEFISRDNNVMSFAAFSKSDDKRVPAKDFEGYVDFRFAFSNGIVADDETKIYLFANTTNKKRTFDVDRNGTIVEAETLPDTVRIALRDFKVNETDHTVLTARMHGIYKSQGVGNQDAIDFNQLGTKRFQANQMLETDKHLTNYAFDTLNFELKDVFGVGIKGNDAGELFAASTPAAGN